MLNADRTRLCVVLFATAIAAMAFCEATDGDLGFHLATGREILRAGRIPSTNVLSFAEPTQPWHLHQWLPALVFEVLFQHGGMTALMSLKLPLIVGTWCFVYAAARALGATPLWAAGTCLFAASASAFRFELRPYLFTHFTLALAVWALARAGTRPRAAQLWAAAALATGCQLHAGAVDTAILSAAYALGTVLEARRAIPQRPYGVRAALGVLFSTGAGLALAALVLSIYHPWGARILVFPFEMAAHTYWGEHLVEFRHAWTLPVSPLLAYWAWLACATAVLLAYAPRLHLGLGLAAAVFACASLWYVRMVYAFAIVSAPLVAAGLTQLGRVRADFRLRYLLFALACVAAPAYVYRDHTPGPGLAAWTWPTGHFDFIRSRGLQGRVFLSDAWGGPFLGTFYPERTVFFDNRLEAYSDAFARETYQRIRYGRPGWDALLDRYDIQVLALRYTTFGEARFQGFEPNLRQRLARDPRFSLLYFDDVGALFVRQNGVNAAVAAGYAIPGVDPDRREFLHKPALSAPALLRAAELGNRSLALIGLTAIALADAGNSQHARALASVMHQRAPSDPFTARVVGRVGAGP